MLDDRKLALFFIGNKGGVGKSKAAKAYIERLRAICRLTGKKMVIVDADPKVGDTALTYGIKDKAGKYDARLNKIDPFNGCLLVDGRNEAENLGNALNHHADFLVFDFPGGETDPSKIMGNVDALVKEFDMEGYDIAVVNVISFVASSAQGVIPAMREWGIDRGLPIKFFVLKNLGLAASDAFIYFDGDQAAEVGDPEDEAEKLGAVVLELPAIDPASFSMLDKKKMPISELIAWLQEQRKDPNAPFGFRARLNKLGIFMAECEPLFQALGLTLPE